MSAHYAVEHRSLYESGAAGASSYPVVVYKHRQTEFRVVVCQVPGPVCHLAMCVPTLCEDHTGKPHTLEHMVFCGSEKHPYLGYIDAVAAHNLGQPMNASTYNDMTLYKYTGLGQEGAANVLPVALDHLMHPLIQDNHFATEVYHIDQDGHQKGAVLSEMSDVVYTESSVRSYRLRQTLYPPSSTYAWICGGLPRDIQSLTTNEILEYHRKYYSYSNLTLLLVGAYDELPAAIFDVLEGLDAEIAASPPPLKCPMPPPRRGKETRCVNFTFASKNMETGTIAFAWEGPPAEDVESYIALDMLIDYLGNDPASPLRKRFTNRPVPIAGDISFGITQYFPAMIELSFTEVPYRSCRHNTAGTSSLGRRDAVLSASYPSPADVFGPVDLAKLHDDVDTLFARNYYKKQLVSTLTYMVDRWLVDNWPQVHSYMARRSASLAAGFAQTAMHDKDPHGILSLLARDAVAHRLSPGSTDLPQPSFASHGRYFSMRRELEQKSSSFWRSLAQKWFLEGHMVHLSLNADPDIDIQDKAERILTLQYRMENMSREELEKVRQQAAAAIELTKTKIPRAVLTALPPVPDISKVQIAAFSSHNFRLADSSASPSPFALGRVLVVPSETGARLQISLPLDGLPADLRPHLPLFVGLLKVSVGLVVPSAIAATVGSAAGLPTDETPGMPYVYVDSDKADGALDKALVEYGACIGKYAGCSHRGSWPEEVLTLYASAKEGDAVLAFTLLVVKLLFGEFSVDAALGVAQAQRRELLRRRGTGSSLLIDTFQWLRVPGTPDARTIVHTRAAAAAAAHMRPTYATHTARAVSEPFGRALNLYFQSAFLTSAIQSLRKGGGGDGLVDVRSCRVLDAIFRIRAHLAGRVSGAGLVHVSLPRDVGAAAARETVDAVVSAWTTYSSAWHECLRMASAPHSPCESPAHVIAAAADTSTPPRKRRRMEADGPATHTRGLVLGGRPGSDSYVALEAPVGVHLALEGLQTSYAGVQIPISAEWSIDPASDIPFDKQLEELPNRDAYALYLLTNILNRTGGLIKNAIRGRGYAYGVGIHPRCDSGYLAVYISHAVDAPKSLEALWETLHALEDEGEWSDVVDEFQLDAARSMFFLHTYTLLSESLVLEDASSLFLGFSGLEQRLIWVRKHVEAVTLADLRRAFLKFFAPLVSKDTASAIYLVATPQHPAGTEAAFLSQLDSNPYGVRFKAIGLTDLDPTVPV